jgi:hypothetical protein
VSRWELDSHTYTCCFSQSCTTLPIDLCPTEDVTPFSLDLGKQSDVPIITVAVTYDSPIPYSTYILILKQRLLIRSLQHHMFCPIQLRFIDVVVNYCPQNFILADGITKQDHSIVAQDIIIPLHIIGAASYFNVRKPSQAEITENIRHKHIFVTNDRLKDTTDSFSSENILCLRYKISVQFCTPPCDSFQILN